MKADVVVVGGGAVGLIAAKTLAENGLETILVEEHEEIGKPEHCAGLFSIINFRRLGIPFSERYIENKVRGAVFYSPRGRRIELDAGRTVAIVTSRSSLDCFLAEEFERRGGSIILNDKVIEICFSGNHTEVKTRKGIVVKAKKVVNAEGVASFLLRKTLKKTTERRMWIPIIQLWVRDHSLDPEYVYLYFEEYLPEFFAYFIPVNDEVGKLGVASRTKLKTKLDKFIKERFPDVQVMRSVSHAVYTGRPLKPDLDSTFIPIGDVAGHVKASTGGGVIMGGLIAKNICEMIALEIMGESESTGYRRRNVESLLRELDRIAIAMKFLRSLPTKTIDKLFKIIDESSLVSEFSQKADMDFQFTSFIKILTKPQNISKLLLASITGSLETSLLKVAP